MICPSLHELMEDDRNEDERREQVCWELIPIDSRKAGGGAQHQARRLGDNGDPERRRGREGRRVSNPESSPIPGRIPLDLAILLYGHDAGGSQSQARGS